MHAREAFPSLFDTNSKVCCSCYQILRRRLYDKLTALEEARAKKSAPPSSSTCNTSTSGTCWHMHPLSMGSCR